MTQVNWQFTDSSRSGGYVVTAANWNDVAADLRAFIDQTTSAATDNTPLPIGIDLVNDRVYISDPDTTTPEDGNHANTTLSVVGTSTFDGKTTVTANNFIVDTDTLFVNAATDRVGVGTTGPTADFEVYGADAEMLAHYTGNSRGGVRAMATNRVAFLSTSSSDDLVFGWENGPAGTFTEQMRLDTGTGNVGIGGTTSPSETLDSTGALRAQSAGADGGIVMGQAFSTSYVGVRTNGMAATGDEYCLLTDGTATYISSGTGGTTYIRGPANWTSNQLTITGSASTITGKLVATGDQFFYGGNLQTGQGSFTQQPWADMSIAIGSYGTVGTQGSYRLGLAWNWERGTDSGYYSLGVNSYTSAGYSAIGNDGVLWGFDTSYGATTWPTERMRLTTTGLGIGTSGPGWRLDIEDAAQARIRVQGGGTGYTQANILLESSTTDTPEDRGLGIYYWNRGDNQTWFTGRPYATSVDVDRWCINRVPATGFQEAAALATSSYTLVTVDTTGMVIGGRDATAPLEISDFSGYISIPALRFTHTATTVSTGETTGQIEFYNSDSGGAGVNARIRAYAFDNAGATALRFDVGTNDTILPPLMLKPEGGNHATSPLLADFGGPTTVYIGWRLGLGTSSPSESLHSTGALRAQSGGADGGIVMGQAYSTSYVGVRTNGMSATGSEYCLLTNGVNTFIGAGSGGTTYIRGAANATGHQLTITSTAAKFSGTVGINASVPNAKLTVEGGIGIGNSSPISTTDGGKRSIQIATDTYYGGTYNAHSGFRIHTQLNAGGWASPSIHFDGASNWGTYGNVNWLVVGHWTASAPHFRSRLIYDRAYSSGSETRVDGDGNLFRFSSSARYKTDIEDLWDAEADKVLDLRPVWFRSTGGLDQSDWSWEGFIAEEVAEINPRWTNYGPVWATTTETDDLTGETRERYVQDADGERVPTLDGDGNDVLRPEGVQYGQMVPALANLIGRQKEQITALTVRLEALEAS